MKVLNGEVISKDVRTRADATRQTLMYYVINLQAVLHEVACVLEYRRSLTEDGSMLIRTRVGQDRRLQMKHWYITAPSVISEPLPDRTMFDLYLNGELNFWLREDGLIVTSSAGPDHVGTRRLVTREYDIRQLGVVELGELEFFLKLLYPAPSRR